MRWLTIAECSEDRGVTQRQIWRLIRERKLTARKGPDHRVYVHVAGVPDPSLYTPQVTLDIPRVTTSHLSSRATRTVDTILTSIGFTDDIAGRERQLALRTGVSVSTQRRYKAKLRKVYGLRSTTPICGLTLHHQIREAIEYLASPKGRTDRGGLRSAQHLSTTNEAGVQRPVSEWLQALYATGRYTATACARRLIKEAHEGRVLNATTSRPATTAELPAIRTVTRYLRRWNAKLPAQKAAFTRRLLRHRRKLLRSAQRYISLLNKVLEDLFAAGAPLDVRVGPSSGPDGTQLELAVSACIRRRGGKRKRDHNSAPAGETDRT